MPGNYSHTTRASGSILTAVIYNGDHEQHVTFSTPAGLDDESANVTAMQTEADPGEQGSESLAGSLQEELYRLRYAIRELKGTTYWYESSVVGSVGLNPYNPEWFS